MARRRVAWRELACCTAQDGNTDDDGNDDVNSDTFFLDPANSSEEKHARFNLAALH